MAWTAPTQESEEIKVSKINAAGLINVTLEGLWKDCYNAMSAGRLDVWNSKLDSIWLILGGDEQEGGEHDKKINEMDLKIYELGSLKQKQTTGFKKSIGDNAAIQYHLLKNKSLFLRRLQNKQGKGTAYSDGDGDDFE